jgi:hypothetical protein
MLKGRGRWKSEERMEKKIKEKNGEMNCHGDLMVTESGENIQCFLINPLCHF